MTGTYRPTTRESLAVYQGRRIVIQTEGAVIRFRLKGTRRWHTASVVSCFVAAARNTAQEIKAAKKAAREQRRKERGG